MKNLEVAKLLNQIADFLDIKGVDFKPVAFRRAARTIESLNKDIEEIAKEGKLQELAGIGRGISKIIIEILETGSFKDLESLKKSIPIDIESLLRIEGIGPKTIGVLYNKLKIKNLKDLERAAKAGKISKLEGFGEKSESEFLEGIKFAKKSNRFLLGYIYPIALDIENKLKKSSEVSKITLAGSIRRMKETIGDIDILVVSKNPKKTMDLFTSLKDVQDIMAKVKTKFSVRLTSGIQVDLRVVKTDEFGAASQYFYGSKEHNVATRKIAISKGLKLNEYGLYKGKKKIAGKDDKEIYKKLGLEYIEPELRENRGEIEAAKSNRLPKLISYNDMRGDLQMHSKWSDGSGSILDMAKKAKELKYEYIAITDHTGNLPIANALDNKRIVKYLKEVEKINKKSKVRIFKGCEVNIGKNGDLELKNDILSKFDFVVASVHSGFKKTREMNTKRILKALENKYVKVLGHPTGRLINVRKGYEVDLQKVFDKSKETDVVLEINAHPERLDLNDINAKSAIENKCKLIISTDAHGANGMDFMKYGIAVARRGWAEKKDIVNTLPLKKFEKFFGI